MQLNSICFKLFLLLSFIAIQISSPVQAQDFYKKYFYANQSFGGFAEVATTKNGSQILVSEINSPISTDRDSISISKFSPCGELIWSYIYPTNYNFIGTSFSSKKLLNVDSKGYPVFVIHAVRSGTPYLVVIKFTPNGNKVAFAKEFTNGKTFEVHHLGIDSQDNLIIGTSNSSSNNTLIILSPQGNILHSNSYNRSNFSVEQGYHFINDSSFLFSAKNTLTYVPQFGTALWKREFPPYSSINGISKTDKGFLLSINQNFKDCFLVKINIDGDIIDSALKIPDFQGKYLINSSNNRSLLCGVQSKPTIGSNLLNTVIHVISSEGKIVNSLHVNHNSLPTSNPISFDYVEDAMFLIDNVPLPQSSNSIFTEYRMLAKLSLDQLNTFCHDIASIDSTSNHSYNNQIKTPDTVKSIPISGSSIHLTSSPYHWLEDTHCSIQRDYSNLFTIDSLILCKGDYIDITRPEIYGTSFSWSTGDTSETIRVYQEGPYWVNMTFPCDDSVYTDTVYVTFYPQADSNIIITPNAAELNETIEFSSSSLNDSVFWKFQDGYTTSEFSFSRSFENSGWKPFHVSFFTSDGCETIIHDSTLVLFQGISIPNVFTPNGDGLNDEMFIKGEGITSFELRIFDRWGSVVVDLQNKNWNGLDKNGNPCSDGVYFYIFDYITDNGEKLTKKGNVTLMRGAP